MPHPSHATQYTHDDHLRHLLDQRNARADVHGRFSAMSEYSDTPSVYSRPYFSPKPSDNGDHHVDDTVYDYASPASSSHLRSNGDRFRDPSSSMLDLEYDPRASYIASEFHEGERLACDDGEDVEPTTRMSYLGPKMRFHSRAPWELDGDALDEEDEVDESPRHLGSGFPFSRSNNSKPHMASPSSPRPSHATSRPSGESSRSQVPLKRSFETINSQISYPRGALYALAQESMSATSLGRIPPGPPKETLRSKFSIGHLRPDTPTGPSPLPPLPAANGRFPPSPTFETSFHTGINFPSSYKALSASEHAHMHPYANPDLVVSYTEADSNNSVSNYPPSRNDSSVTVTESFSIDSMVKSSARSTLTSDSSVNSIVSKHRASSILSKNISSPVPVVSPSQGPEASASDNNLDHSANSLPPNVASLPGWTERNTAPTFSLISLEEARAQRARNTSLNPNPRISSSSAISNNSTSNPTPDTETLNTLQEVDASPVDTIPSRTRGRSMSAGAKARNAIQTIVGQPKVDRRDTEPPSAGQPPLNNMPQGKSLKHKKSGFMRLFNGNKSHEKDERDEPPPVPALPENDSHYQSTQRTLRSNVQRIPVLSLTPSLFEVASTQSIDTFSESVSWKSTLLSPKRTPTLSINTVPNGGSRSSTSAVIDRDSRTQLEPMPRPWLTNQQPQSAPANITEFPALRLRPVSTLFSAHFGDHIVTAVDSRSSDETTDPDTPRSSSPNGLMSPITPGSFTRTSNEQIVTTATSDDDQATIKNLQKQMASAKTAWQRHIRELEGQVRDLKAELEETKGKYGDDHCNTCGRGSMRPALPASAPAGGGVVNRPRARTGTSSRFGNAHP